MTPSAGASRPAIATWEKCGWAWMPNSQNVPSSIRSARRSRAVSLSWPCCLAIRSSPPPAIARSRRSARSSTSGRSRLAGCSVVDMCLLEDGLEHTRNGVRVIGVEERGDLHAHHLALVGDSFQQVVELVRAQPARDRELGGHELGIEHVHVEMDVHRRAVECILNRDERVEPGPHDGHSALLDQLALTGIEIA